MPLTQKQCASIHDFFKNKTVLIAGTSSGIGAAVTHFLAEIPCRLILLSRNAVESKTHIHDTSKASIEAYDCDLRDSEALRLTLDGARKPVEPDIVLFSVGVSMFEEIEHTNESVFKELMESNFYSFVYLYKYLLPALRQKKGKLCVISSIQSIIGVQFHGAYVSAKHALTGFLKVIELETPELTIIEILPGWIKDTNIRKNAIDGQGKSLTVRSQHEHQDRSTVELSHARNAILMSFIQKKRKVFLPHFWRFIPFLQFATPKYLKSLILKRNKKESKVE